jgi:type VI secretion system secreted protein Hcp
MPFDTFLKIDGVDGESSDAKHKGEIEILSFSWGVSQAITGTVSSSGTFSGQRCDMTALTVVKQLDKASPKLAQGCAAGDHFASATLTLCRSAGDKQPYMKYKLSDVLLESVRTGGAGDGEGGVPTEEVGIRYAKIELEYTVVGTDGKAAGNVTGGWDLKENKKV